MRFDGFFSDLDDAVRKGDHSLNDIFNSDPPSQSRSLFGNFNGGDLIPKHGGEISSAFKYSTIRKKLNPDGVRTDYCLFYIM